MSQIETPLQIRTELFDHGIFPSPQRLNHVSLINIVKSLYLISTLDGKISVSHWVEVAIKHLGLNIHEAEVYFEVFRALGQKRLSADPLVDLKSFSVFLALQTYSSSSTRNSIENASSLTSKYNTEYFGHQSNSPAASPRSKSSRGFVFGSHSSEYQIQQHFVKNNLKVFLRVVSNELQSQDVHITQTDLNALNFLFTPVTGVPGVPLSRLCPFFAGRSAAQSVSSDQISDWMIDQLNSTAYDTISNFPSVLFLNNLSRSVAIKGIDDSGKDVRILNCEEAYIYINAPVKQVSILNCKDVTCFIAAVERICTIDKCENCNVVLSTHLVRIGNCVDCQVYTYSMFPPVLYGDNRGVTLGPMSVFYGEMVGHVQAAGLQPSQDNQQPKHNWSSPIEINTEANTYTLLQPKDFYPLVLPNLLNPETPMHIFTPDEYIEALNLRENYFKQIQTQISKAGLNEEQQKKLHMAIQGYYREWLVSSGNIKGPTELVRMIDQEQPQ